MITTTTRKGRQCPYKITLDKSSIYNIFDNPNMIINVASMFCKRCLYNISIEYETYGTMVACKLEEKQKKIKEILK